MAEALAGAFTVAGLTAQAGGSVKVDGNTWQVRLTVPVNPPTEPTVTVADEVPSGGIATGVKADASRVKLCAEAEIGRLKSAASRQRAARMTRAPPKVNAGFAGWACDGSDVVWDLASDFIADVVCDFISDLEVSAFNMSRFRFN